MQKEKKSLVYYMNALRRQQGISMGQLCEGLCNERVLSYLEKGERRIGYFLQRRILERLGIDTWDYEVFVGKGECHVLLFHHLDPSPSIKYLK